MVLGLILAKDLLVDVGLLASFSMFHNQNSPVQVAFLRIVGGMSGPCLG